MCRPPGCDAGGAVVRALDEKTALRVRASAGDAAAVPSPPKYSMCQTRVRTGRKGGDVKERPVIPGARAVFPGLVLFCN